MPAASKATSTSRRAQACLRPNFKVIRKAPCYKAKSICHSTTICLQDGISGVATTLYKSLLKEAAFYKFFAPHRIKTIDGISICVQVFV